ncbi:MAG TPA: SNF2-related protein [Chitinophagaceae bacterium]|nr:SNF2-related protein [Chitinophagaceae bacterium]
MSLPHLLKYIYNNGTEEVIRRGKRIYATGGVELVFVDQVMKTVTFRVKSDTHFNFYKVTISKYHEQASLSVRCQCPYNLGDICRHEAAALFRLQEMLDRNDFNEKDLQYDQHHTVIRMKSIDLKTIRLLTSREIFNEAEDILRSQQALILSAKDERVEASLEILPVIYHLIIGRNDERHFDTHCDCGETDHPLCTHKTALFLQLLNAYGPYYFDTLRNWDKEKNQLLATYGYSVDDDLGGKFSFTYTNGKPFLRVLDPSIRKLAPDPVPAGLPVEAPAVEAAFRLALVINFNEKSYPWFAIDLAAGELNEEMTQFISFAGKLDLTKYIDYFLYREKDRGLIPAVRKLMAAELNKYLNKNSPFEGIWDNIHQDMDHGLPADTRTLILEYLHPKLQKLLEGDPQLVFTLAKGQGYRTANLEPIHPQPGLLRPVFRATAREENVEVSCFVEIEEAEIPFSENACGSPLLFLHKENLYLLGRPQDALHTEPFLEKEPLKFSAAQWPDYLRGTLLPLSQEYTVHFDPALVDEADDILPEPVVYLKELGESFVIRPAFYYQGQEVQWDEGTRIVIQQDSRVLIIHRNLNAEQAFIESIRSLHPRFQQPTNHHYFYLRSRDALSSNWFFRFFDTLREKQVRVLGYETLKNFRFSPHRPETQLQISSGIDWFDARVEVTYGGELVSIGDIKQALSNKQNYIQLLDGSLGLLPEEWLKKYSLLFRIGEEKGKALKLSKYNFGVIDELFEYIDDEAIQAELEEKRRKLLKFEEVGHADIPANIKAVLRPYQESGLHWLNYLDEIRWGGILADDMGLGKTVQALAFLQHFKNKFGHCLAVVVCPTTLIYNWENEILKFTPELSYHIHHGAARARNAAELRTRDVLITTYGTLRSDVQMLMELQLDYVILDESQAIKNPHSKVARAAQLLHTRNRLCLSGTPMQNNTFDIYAQMNFLNPGMLGSIDFFRNEFANPIDKLEDEERKTHLRKLIYPFILRRTKEQVARDLPEKTEIVLYCEMEQEQKNIYELFRGAYRSKILGAIDEKGMDRSQLTILQGLMKLRQICDSPAILNEDQAYPNHSIKLEELIREITENIGNHKVLVFSQFLGMLALIRTRLEELDIPLAYFDGSTTAPDREKAINKFQEEELCRVFLISLKAGGVGLNLTAADYVYIVDPWWNPAVEQQAIDRTHRIGQTKSIFAYRMICKDSIEEKILQLQEKKKSLVKDIVSDETGFIKKLTREDVLYLFS